MKNWYDVAGFFSTQDAEEYNRLVNLIPDGGLLVEIGSFNGRSMASLAETIKRKKLRVWVIDLFETWRIGYLGSEKYKEADGWIDAKDMLLRFATTMQEFGLDPMIFCGTSQRVVKEFPNIKPDMVFIDADHSYDGCMGDINTWMPQLGNGGIIAGHDYDPTGISWPGVYLAVNKAFGNDQVATGRDCPGRYIWSVQL